MKMLVTGGAGFIGSNLVDRLISDGHTVTVIDNESSDSNSLFYWNPSANNYKYDINDIDRCGSLYEGIDCVFHLAAEARIQPCITNPIKAIQTNTVGTASVLQCAKEKGVKRVVYSSTSSAYGLKNTPPLVETMPNDCLNPYSVSKTAGEELCKMYSKLYGLETVIFRYFNVYGERQPIRGQYAPVIGIFLRQKSEGLPMTIIGDGNQRRDFTHVSDVVEANVLASKFQKPDFQEIVDGGCKTYLPFHWGQVYNVGTGKNYSINQIADMMGGHRIHIEPRIGESATSLADSSKAKQHLGWISKINIEEWIKKELINNGTHI